MAEIAPTEAITETEKVIKINFRVLRYHPEADKKPYIKEFAIPVTRGMTVLDGLIYAKEHFDGTLSYRASCRMGICGSCGMFVNRLPRLSCQTQILDLGSETIEVKPLPNFANVKDLVPDLEPFFDKHRSVKPFIIRKDESEPLSELLQSPQELEDFLQFSYCIKCGLCVSACPTAATDRRFFGPQALAQSYRYSVDSRDEGFEERLKVVDSRHGLWRCHFAGACSEACPKGVDPALAIQLSKRRVVFGSP